MTGVAEAPSVQGATELVSKLCSGGMPKAFVSKVIKIPHATSPSLCVPSVTPCYCVYLRSLRFSVCLIL
ncbi:hypothetical protein KZO53_04695 [Prevotella melaninogenica]|uniref:hypothetical protein n=1 Tax=Prevotella melaninogenica TaxID=28132 RepID=UPI001C5D98E0|nr:hypothetical protein [Prevotella melaninogenica]MBW4761802.1 hypothetical protein [Prevotella melaninogenica]